MTNQFSSDSGDVEIRKLSMEHLKEVYQLWHMQHIHTINELEDAFQLNGEFALGLFCKKTDRLLGWCLRATFGGIGFRHVRAEARGNGYARLLVAQITKKLTEFSIEPFTLIRNSNESSIRVFTDVGFHRVSQISRFLISK